jgi:hypothetical protein
MTTQKTSQNGNDKLKKTKEWLTKKEKAPEGKPYDTEGFSNLEIIAAIAVIPVCLVLALLFGNFPHIAIPTLVVGLISFSIWEAHNAWTKRNKKLKE